MSVARMVVFVLVAWYVVSIVLVGAIAVLGRLLPGDAYDADDDWDGDYF